MIWIIPILLQDAVTLEHRGARAEFHQVIQFGIEFKGDEDQCDKLRAISPFLSIQNLVLDAEATHEVNRTPTAMIWKYKYQKAKVFGTYADEKFEFQFAADKKENTEGSKFKAAVYTIFSAGRTHKLTRLGAMEDFDPTKDPNGEALDLILFPMPRFPDKPVKVGDTWSEEWLTRTKDKDSGYRLKLKQSVTLEKLDGAVARLKVNLGGQIQKPDHKKGFADSVTPEGEACVLFDMARGQVVGYDSRGSVDVHIKGADPNSTEEFDLHLILKGSGKLGPLRE
jgi:hypothetical protein